MEHQSNGTQLNARNLYKIDKGKVGLAIDHAIKTAIMDIQGRHGDRSKRSVVIKMHATPTLAETDGGLDTIDLQFQIAVSLPHRSNARPYRTLPMKDGVAVFQPDSPEDPRQLPLYPAELGPQPHPEITDEDDEPDVGQI